MVRVFCIRIIIIYMILVSFRSSFKSNLKLIKCMQTVALGDTVDERVGEMAEQITVCDLKCTITVPLYRAIEFYT